MINNKVKIEFIDFSGRKRIKAPFMRVFWYFVTLGKWGERYHYQHVMMRKYFPTMDRRIAMNISAIDNLTNKFIFPKVKLKQVNQDYWGRIHHYNCRCSMARPFNKEIK